MASSSPNHQIPSYTTTMPTTVSQNGKKVDVYYDRSNRFLSTTNAPLAPNQYDVGRPISTPFVGPERVPLNCMIPTGVNSLFLEYGNYYISLLDDGSIISSFCPDSPQLRNSNALGKLRADKFEPPSANNRPLGGGDSFRLG